MCTHVNNDDDSDDGNDNDDNDDNNNDDDDDGDNDDDNNDDNDDDDDDDGMVNDVLIASVATFSHQGMICVVRSIIIYGYPSLSPNATQ
ncbi:unnamed protein product [Cercopithifilaria johnstoni]|uniref:Uncharacterized protein n=1 Tax=Cercopithifilaria johnstoni TaxID=2874296 RepID=A0A8J2M3N8_9BILA|nr:unnamed protein product [Cercopithifilaria johnstoni]